jgi:hypothetical protein
MHAVRRAVHVAKAVGGLCTYSGECSVKALDLALLLCSGATTSTSAMVQRVVQGHDAGGLVAVVIGNKDFHGHRMDSGL